MMTRFAGTAAAVSLCAATFGLAAATVSDDQVITRRFPLAPGGAVPEVVVSLINGPIRVTAHDTAEVALDAKVHLEASDAARLADMKNRVRLESEQAGQNVWIGVEADWDNWSGRSGVGGGRRPRELGWRGKSEARERDSTEREFSRFRHEVELRVPKNAHLKLRTVNGGEIAVTGVEGEFDLSTVNGGIALQRAAGYGTARTVNGPVSLGFRGHPTGAIRARTVNGAVTLAFPAGLNATLRLNNRHGGVTTDFPLTAAATASSADGSVKPEEKGMKRIWTSGRASELRAGVGTGPLIEAQTVNGAIRILENNGK